MRIRSFSTILDECLAAIQQGESVNACLTRYPRQADRLRPLLLLAERVRKTPASAPRPWAQATAWNIVRLRAADLRSGRRRRGLSLDYGAWLRPLAIAVSLVLALGAGTGATALAAQSSLPDSPLYRVKLATEDVRLWFVFDEAQEASILMDQSDERIQEITSMVSQGKALPDNVLSALRNRNERAANILSDRPQETSLRGRILQQAESQEKLLFALWPDVKESARREYTEAVAVIHNTRLSASGALVSAVRPEDLAGGVLNISGLAQPVADGVWSVGGVDVRVDERTIGSRELQPGATAKFIVARSPNGRLQALTLTPVQANTPPPGAVVSGALEEVTNEGIRVGGQLIPFNRETLFRLKLKEGERVEVTLESTAGGVVAAAVEAEEGPAEPGEVTALTYEGTIEGDVKNTNEWTIGGLEFEIRDSTVVDATAGDAVNGARAEVEVAFDDDEQLQAERVTVLAAAGESDAVRLVGTFQGPRSGLWMISGLAMEPQPGGEEPPVGSLVAAEARWVDAALRVATVTVIQKPEDKDLVRVRGTIKSIDNAIWNLEIGQVRVKSTAEVSGKIVQGARVIVWGEKGDDGVLKAVYARVLDQKAVAAPP